jgi:hypothetical protein
MARLHSVLDTAMSVCIASAAGLEAAIEIQKRLPATQEMILPLAAWSSLAPLALLVIVAALWIVRLLVPAGRAIEILTPLESGVVPDVFEVRGSVWPAGAPVQVFVFSEREWRPQQLPTRDGALWSARCHFDGGDGGGFKIAAVSRRALVVGAVRSLPRWATTTSRIVRVTRQEA